MAWPRDPVTEIDRLIAHHHDDQIANEILHGEAEDAERRAVEAQVAAQAIQTRTQVAIDLDVAEIARLKDEREVYLPPLREPEPE